MLWVVSNVMTDDNAGWRTSSFCAKADCLAVCQVGEGLIAVRNTRASGSLVIGANSVVDWLAGVKAGEFDHLAPEQLPGRS